MLQTQERSDSKAAPPAAPRAAADADWWRGAVIYQVYPRSFADTNGDGIGDLAGVLAQLDYIASLGVDAIWLSPFFKSPMKDFGYDVSAYRQVDPIFGTLEDFDRLVAAAHERGLRIIIDQVLNHTSDQHAWFQQSRGSRDNAKADWYVWAEPKPDGTPPNNWLSIFGGSAWQWEPRRGQYYLHNFLVSQPDLNYHNPAVRRADARGGGVLAGPRASTASGSMRSTSASTTRCCATIRRSRRRSARDAASASTIPTPTRSISTTTRNRRTTRSSNRCGN